MSRQLRRGAVITATLAGAAFAATAPALADSPDGQLEIRVHSELSGATQQWTLTCGPDGGSHSDAQAACDRLREANGDLESIRTISGPCPRVYDPEQVTIMGTWSGEPVYFDQSYPNAYCLLATAKPIVPEAAESYSWSAVAPAQQPEARPAADRVQIIDRQAAEDPADGEDQQQYGPTVSDDPAEDPTNGATEDQTGDEAGARSEDPSYEPASEQPAEPVYDVAGGRYEAPTYAPSDDPAEDPTYGPAEDQVGDADEAGGPTGGRADDQAGEKEDRQTGGREFPAQPDQDDELDLD
jgi:hypothetical protein